jgi:hypothetical protein
MAGEQWCSARFDVGSQHLVARDPQGLCDSAYICDHFRTSTRRLPRASRWAGSQYSSFSLFGYLKFYRAQFRAID